MRIEVHHFHHGTPEMSASCCCAFSEDFKTNVLTTLSRLIESVGRVLTNQQEESLMSSQQHDLIARLVADVAAERTEVDSVKALVLGIPAVVRAAVQQALDANPALTPEDLAAVTNVADEMERQTAEIHAAVQANSTPTAGGGAGETPPATGNTTGVEVAAPPASA